MSKGYVYILIDPRYNDGHSKHVRYVGITNNIAKRMSDHWCTKGKRTTHKGNWLKSLAKICYTEVFYEIVEELDCASRSELADAEKYWIAQFKAWGFDLTNMTSGGDGMHDLSLESRKLIGDACRTRMLSLGDNHQSKSDSFRKQASARMSDPSHPIRSESSRKKSGDSRKGTRTGDENSAKRPDVRKKISEAKKGDHHHAKTQEWRTYFSNLMKGRFAGDKNPAKQPGVGNKISTGRKGLCTGKAHPRSKSIICIDTGVTYDTIKLAVEWLKSIGKEKAHESSISGVCRGKCKRAYGYKWAYVENKDTLANNLTIRSNDV